MADEPRKMGPLKADHPCVTRDDQFCPGCDKAFNEGDFVTLVVIGPGEDPEARELARNGRFYNAIAKVAHWACVTGEE